MASPNTHDSFRRILGTRNIPITYATYSQTIMVALKQRCMDTRAIGISEVAAWARYYGFVEK